MKFSYLFGIFKRRFRLGVNASRTEYTVDSRPAVDSTASNDKAPAAPTPHWRADYHTYQLRQCLVCLLRQQFLPPLLV